MKLMIIFDKAVRLTPEKALVHVGHVNRIVSLNTNTIKFNTWSMNDFKSVIIYDKIPDKLRELLDNSAFEIRDAGLDGKYPKDTLLGYALLVPNSDETFKRLRLLKIKDLYI